MKKRSEELALRRQALELRSERLRRDLANDAEIVSETVARADHVMDSARRYGSPAMLVLGGVLLVLLIANPARSVAFITRGLVALSVARRAFAIFRSFKAELGPPRV
jgi:hypothetical protein